MDFSVTKENDNYVLDIKIPKSAVNKEINEIAKAIQPQANIKGYRKGNVPLDVVKGTYRSVIKAEASTRLLYNSVSEVLREEKIRNAGNPVLFEEYRPSNTKQHVGLFGLDGSLKFKVSVELPPEVTLKRYKGIEIEGNSANYEEWIKKELYKQQVVLGDKKEVTRASKKGDELVIDFSGKLNNEKFEGGSHADYVFTLGEGGFVPGFEEQFTGKEPNTEFSFPLTFPEEYPEPKLAGKEVVFDCALKEVHEVTPHPLNEDLAMMLSYESVDDMMDQYKEMWEDEFSKPMRAEIFNKIMDVIIEENPFKVPDNWVEQEIKLTMARMGATTEQLKGNDALFESVKTVSERSVRISFLSDKIYEMEDSIHLSADDIESIANRESAEHGISGLEYLDALRKNGQYETFVAFQEQQRVIDFLIENAKEKVDE